MQDAQPTKFSWRVEAAGVDWACYKGKTEGLLWVEHMNWASVSPSSKGDPRKPCWDRAPSKPQWPAKEARLASFVIENIIVTTVCFSRGPFALGVAESIDVFLVFSPLYSSWVILGQAYICQTFHSTWVDWGASKDPDALGFLWHFIPCSILCDGCFVFIAFDWHWVWVPTCNVFYIHLSNFCWSASLTSVCSTPQMQNFICI